MDSIYDEDQKAEAYIHRRDSPKAEFEEAGAIARDACCKDLVTPSFTSSYPVPINQANVRQILELAKRLGVLTGLYDPTTGTMTSVAEISLGACLFEKHIKLRVEDKRRS